jgi:hypothetical protein
LVQNTSYASAPIEGHAGATAEDVRRDPRTGVPERIHAFRPNAKFIYVLRNPVTRTYSAYWHTVRAGEEYRPFREAISSDPDYLSASDYYGQLQNYLKYFPINSFHFVIFEEMRLNPLQEAQRCLDFLGVGATNFDFVLDAPKNPSYIYNPAGKILTILFPGKSRLETATRIVKRVVPAGLHPLIRRIFTKDIPRLQEDDRCFLLDYFRERNIALQRLAGISIEHWCD